ncbi:MAG TPA: NAD-dependent epimerase/dehydratase family protein [Methylomirabilota bacterium]|jgi:nucleoside-diphosphate-sugar epimerase|nr:NAD-dependent epimerase/dehydratase family protein [Methylomirabilota bacterium]
MRALVTGGTGFIGEHLVSALRDRGASVRAPARAPEHAASLRALGAEVVAADLARPDGLAGAMAGVDVVFHLAGQIRPTADGAAAYRRNNVEATANLLAACRGRALSAFVHVSSVGVLGALRDLPASEATPCAPDSEYGASKHEAELLVRRAVRDEGLPAVVARPAWVYGPGDRRTRRLFAAIQRRRFVLVGSGLTWLHPAYVGDVVEGLLRCATEPKAVGETYILAGPEPVRLRALVGLIAELLGVPPPALTVPPALARVGAGACEWLWPMLGQRPPLYRRQLEFFLRDQRFDTAKARDELGFVPATPLREGLARTIAWYREHGLLA